MEVIYAIVQIFFLDGSHPTAMQTSRKLFVTRAECEHWLMDYTKMIGGTLEFESNGWETVMHRITRDQNDNIQSSDMCVRFENAYPKS